MLFKTCFYCENEAVSDCTECRLVSICADEEHEKIHHLQEDAKKCRPFRVIRDKDKGQCLVASRDIRPMEEIFCEEPVVIGPYAWPSKPQCLQCFRTITESQKCFKCHYPVCLNERCQKGNWHLIECQIFQSVNHHYDYDDEGHLTPYAAITTLRFIDIINKNENPSLCEALFTLRDHNVERRRSDPDLWAKHEDRVGHFLVNVCKMASNVEMVHRAMGILATNSANLDFPTSDYGKGCGLYPTFAKVNHSCMANTKNGNNLQRHQLQLRSCCVIRAGEEITNIYVKSSSNTLSRQIQLESKWHFKCCCHRCLDPYEMGSNLSTLKCINCDSGRMVCQDLAQLQWICDICQCTASFDYMMKCIKEAKGSLKRAKATTSIIDIYEQFLYENSAIFHPNHETMIDVKMHLAVLYGNLRSHPLFQLTRPQLERKMQCLRDVLTTLSQVEQGYSSTKGKMLNELGKTMLCKARRDFQDGLINQQQMTKILKSQQETQAYIALNQSFFAD